MTELEEIALALRELDIRRCREDFWFYCHITDSYTGRKPVFTEDKLYLKSYCNDLQAMYEGTLLKLDGTPYDKFIINMPPGFAKSYTLILFCQWLLGKNKHNEIMNISYGDKPSSHCGTSVRDGIMVKRDTSKLDISYSDIFPETKVKHGEASKMDWALEGVHHSFLATTLKGQLTSMRGNIAIIDDPIKDATDACNEQVLENVYSWYTDTFLSRVVENGLQIVVQTRWNTKDLCGRLLADEPDDWYVIKYEAMNEDTGEMLCEAVMSKKTYEYKKRKISSGIFNANYHQRPIDEKGKLISITKEYIELPDKLEGIYAVCDTADTGKDSLCCIVYGKYKGQAYIIDVYFSKDPMEISEPAVAKMLHDNKVQRVIIESNNGGRGFARNVERLLYDNHKNRQCNVQWYHQSLNKIARILSNATNVMNNIYYPEGWKQQWKAFYNEVNSYQREGRNQHDDALDTLVMIIEKLKDNNWFFA